MFKGIALFGTGLFIVVLAFSAISVYVLDEFDQNLGRGISFRILSWIAALLGIVGALGFASGVAIFRAVPKTGLAGTIGVGAGVATLIVMMLATGGRNSRGQADHRHSRRVFHSWQLRYCLVSGVPAARKQLQRTVTRRRRTRDHAAAELRR